jgi:hypothetical protein
MEIRPVSRLRRLRVGRGDERERRPGEKAVNEVVSHVA